MGIYFQLGLEHITDINGYDHILFILVLCCKYDFSRLKQLALLVTAFTIGHSISLLLSTLNTIAVPPSVVEFLIPVSILLTALYYFFFEKTNRLAEYSMTSLFGLIHGMGFSLYLQAILGKAESIFLPLLLFNIGLEIGQLSIVVAYLAILLVMVRLLGVEQKRFESLLIGIALCSSYFLAQERIFW